MTRLAEDLVAMNAAAIRMKVSILVGEGMPMKDAKKKAIADYAMRALIPEIRDGVVHAVYAMTYADLHPADSRKVDDRHFDDGVKLGLWRDYWFNRLFFRWTGMTL